MPNRLLRLISWFFGAVIMSTWIANQIALFAYDYGRGTLAQEIFGFYGVTDVKFAGCAIVIAAWLRRCPGNPGHLKPWVSWPKAERKPYAQIAVYRGADRLDSQGA